MSGKLFLLLGVLGVGGYAIVNHTPGDPTLFPLPKEKVVAMLAEGRTTMPRRDGDGEIKIWSSGTSMKGVTLNMQYASWAPMLSCEAIVTSVTPEESRVVTDCGGGDSTSAIANTQDQLRAPMFEEHVQATLRGRPFDRASVDAKETAIAMGNLGGMQREALKRSDEMQRMTANSR